MCLLLKKSILCKHSWHFTKEREAFWKQVISGNTGKAVALLQSKRKVWGKIVESHQERLEYFK